jgi:hypothetical protein
MRRNKICHYDDWNQFTQSRTTCDCQELATVPVYTPRYRKLVNKEYVDVEPTIQGWLCPKHAKQFDLLRMTADAVVNIKHSLN